MLATARAIAGPASAEDIVQEAWVTVFERVHTFEARASLNTWLQRIVANRAISVLRSRARTNPPASNADDVSTADWFDETGHWRDPRIVWSLDSPEALLAADALQDCIDEHLAAMPESQRSVVVLRDMEERTFEDICNELGLSASNVRVLLHRGRMRLMKMVDRFEETGEC
jgi:RNA polymerase sigma-70 factor (ECF subfamily)